MIVGIRGLIDTPGYPDFSESDQVTNLGINGAVSIPVPKWANTPAMALQKEFWGGGMQGMGMLDVGGVIEWMKVNWMVTAAGAIVLYLLLFNKEGGVVTEKFRGRRKK